MWFVLFAGGIMLNHSLTCVQICDLSYKLVGEGCYFFEVDDLAFGHFVDDTAKTQYVVFRGSANIENWLKNARFLPNFTKTGLLAHGGFVSCVSNLFLPVLNTIRKDYKLIFTGHSLGAAIALLFAEFYGKSNCEVITFGCPRVYLRFSQKPDVKHSRYVCDDDPVPLIPHLLYCHESDAIVLKDKDRKLVEAKDHGITIYLRRIQNG